MMISEEHIGAILHLELTKRTLNRERSKVKWLIGYAVEPVEFTNEVDRESWNQRLHAIVKDITD